MFAGCKGVVEWRTRTVRLLPIFFALKIFMLFFLTWYLLGGIVGDPTDYNGYASFAFNNLVLNALSELLKIISKKFYHVQVSLGHFEALFEFSCMIMPKSVIIHLRPTTHPLQNC